MKKLIISIALLIMSAICIQGAFAQEVIVERQVDLSIKFYGNGVVSDDGINKTGTTFTYVTSDLITRFGMATGTSFSNNAILIEQMYFDGIAASTMPTEPYMVTLIVRDGINDLDVGDYINYQPVSPPVGKVKFAAGKGGNFILYDVIFCNLKNMDIGEEFWLIGFQTETGKLSSPPYVTVSFSDWSLDAEGYFSHKDVNNIKTTYVGHGAIKYSNAQIVSANQ